MKSIKSCSICGGSEFSYSEVLWPELISAWELVPYEAEYINRQQGFSCMDCGNNLRSMALADTLLNYYEFSGVLVEFVVSDIANNVNLLEINEAGGLSEALSKMPNRSLIEYPEYDIQNLPFESEIFDIVLHSDTLEHIYDPVKALVECRRVLKRDGACLYTVPVVVNRLSRSREGLAASYHGSNNADQSDLKVHTEFGADVWKYAFEAGFKTTTLHCLEYPAGIAIEARV